MGTIIQRKAHYVKTLDPRPDGTFNVTLTGDIKDAKEFETRQEANKKKEKFHNPFERQFEVEEKEVDWPAKAAISVPGDLH